MAKKPYSVEVRNAKEWMVVAQVTGQHDGQYTVGQTTYTIVETERAVRAEQLAIRFHEDRKRECRIVDVQTLSGFLTQIGHSMLVPKVIEAM
jgi:hypothetical protein